MPQAKNLSVSIHDEPILDGLDLTVHTGEVAAIVGPNGSGMRKPIGIVLGGIAR
jgi:Fe-S cluster assembly ATP-binding protein